MGEKVTPQMAKERRNSYVVNESIDHKLYGTGLLDLPLAPDRNSFLKDKFLVLPYSIIDATTPWWLNRRRAWHSLGFDSTAGRPENMLNFSEAMKDSMGDIPVGRFDPVLCELAYRWWCPPGGTIIDPFCGGSVRGIVAEILEHPYIGVDLREEQVLENRRQASELDLNPTYFIGDSRNFASIVDGRKGDFIFSSPPYFWREHHCDLPEDLNNSKNYQEFLEGYRQTIASVMSCLNDNRFACFEVAEIRDRKTGLAPDFVGDTIRAFVDAGGQLYQHAIHAKSIGVGIRANRIFTAGRKLVPVHEDVIVIVKGDPKKAVEACELVSGIKQETAISPSNPAIVQAVVPSTTRVTLKTLANTSTTRAGERNNTTRTKSAVRQNAIVDALKTPTAPAAQAPIVAAVRPLKVEVARVNATPKEAYSDPFLVRHAKLLAEVGNSRLRFEEEKWLDPPLENSTIFLDIEVFRNFFVVCLKRPDGRRVAFEMSDRCPLDIVGLRAAMKGAQVITFNGAAYDIPILLMALRGDLIEALKAASDQIIAQGMKPWESEKIFDVGLPSSSNHIDMVELCVRASLKVLYGRLHGKLLVDLPFDPNAALSYQDMNVATLYCMNDLDATQVCWEAMADRIVLRESFGRMCGLDLRSKSDAQMGEAIIRRNLERMTRTKLKKPTPEPSIFHYQMPNFINFNNTEMQSVVSLFNYANFRADGYGNIEPPEFLKNLNVRIGDANYAMGIGGLHSQEACRAFVSDDNYQLVDVDVSSHYPRIILRLGLCPPAAGLAFVDVYRELMEERLAAKAAGDKAKADGAKIALNGCFGKLGSPYSFLYAPDMLIAVTLTGQLSILMLIEQAEAAGIQVASANTDGVLFYCRRDLLPTLDEIVAGWEMITEFTTDRQNYHAIYSSSVNAYIAVKEDGKTKRKGPIADPWKEGNLREQMAKNPQMTICAEAAERLAVDGVPLADTVRACRDPRRFVTLIRVNGGAVWRGQHLGRAVRYYWSTDGEPISYINANRKVAKTEDARPMMELATDLPDDLDFDRYVAEANKIAREYAIIRDEGLMQK